ncbi:MAG: hypothetical protein JWQ78_1669 [Sediminibacterium sp.]|nr:hypothetical protein [Sediminibacterium sp.]
MQFVHSIWLWSIAGIAVPVIIHLWNIREGKTRKVGSIAFLTASARSHARSFRLSEWWLLLTRCLLLILLALLISQPFFEKQSNVAKEKGWILVPGSSVQEAYQKYSSVMDSLLAAGYSFHFFAKEFPEVKFAEALKRPAGKDSQDTQPYWSRLQELNQRVPPEFPVRIFTDDRLAHFSGRRPAVTMNLVWQTFSSKDTAATWLSNAFETVADSTRIVIGTSTHNGVYFTGQDLSTHTTDPKFTISKGPGKIMVGYNDMPTVTGDHAVVLDTTALQVFIYMDKAGPDAGYLSAALTALREFTQRRIKTTFVSRIELIPANSDWIFWLSETQVPAVVSAKNLFTYEKGSTREMHSTLLTGDQSNGGDNTGIYKMIEPAQPANGFPVWKNGYGHPLLSKESGKNNRYHFYSRFDPQWSGLVWSGQFPQLIYDLLFATAPVIPATVDTRRIDAQQVVPAIVSEKELLPKQFLTDRVDLTKLCWLAAFVLLLVERLLSYRNRKGGAYA